MMTSAISPRRADRRGLTLLELILALGLVMAIIAISVPFTFREFARQEASSTLDRVAMQVALARVESRQTGVPHQLLVDPTGRRLNVRPLDPRDPGSIGNMNGDSSAIDSDRELAVGFSSAEEMPEKESWQVIQLPVGMWIGPDLDEEFLSTTDYDPDGIEALLSDGDLADTSDPWPEMTRLVVFMPDGTLLGMQPLIFTDPQERRRLFFDPWTGQLRAEVIRLESIEDAMKSDETSMDDSDLEPVESIDQEEAIP